jgi:dTDP-4-amino-4,6-dideoxygalactose transaminase
MKINYPLASSSWDEKEIEAINDVIDGGMYSMSNHVKEYEEQFAKKFDSNHCVMVNSGSSANLLMIASLFYKSDSPLQRGDEVIVPSVSWSTTYAPLQQYGLHVKFVDVCPDTLNIDLKKFKEAVSKKTKAVVLVNLLGNCNNYEEVKKILDEKDLSPYVLEDNAESMGAEFKGIKAGSYGLMGTFSSFFSHHISTMEGGCIITNDEELFHILLCIRAHGWTRNLPDNNLVTGRKDEDNFQESFRFVLPGYNVRPLEMSGAIGKQQIKKLDSLIEGRRKNAEYFVDKISKFKSLTIQKETGKSSWFGFSVIVSKYASYNREMLIKSLQSNGIEYRPIVTGNFLKNKAILKYYDYEISGDMSGAELIEENGLFLGNHHYDLSSQIDLFYEVVSELERS